jgi:hypothetical protein
MAQYAISKINDKRLLIDAAEFGWIKEHGSSLENLRISATCSQDTSILSHKSWIFALCVEKLVSSIALRLTGRSSPASPIPRTANGNNLLDLGKAVST